MKLILLSVILLSPCFLLAQDWTPQTSGTANPLYSVYFTDDNTGWAVGWNGTILHTMNGGTSWTTQISGTTHLLYSTFFIDTSTGWAVGGEGTIRHTANGGATWTNQGGALYSVLSVFFTDASTGWAVGWNGSILYTTNGGPIWRAQTSGTSHQLNSVFFTDASTGWAVGGYDGLEGTILHTTDGGTSWTAQTSGTRWMLESVFFVDASTGWAVGGYGTLEGTILHTTDAGTTWTAQTSGTTQGLYSVFFTDGSTGWAVGSLGTILHTTNSGTDWIAQSSGTSVPLNSIHFTDAGSGWAVGWNGTILYYSGHGTPGPPPVSVVASALPTSGDGTFDYTIDFTNNTDGSQTVDLWTEVVDPRGARRVAHVVYGTTILGDSSFSKTATKQLGEHTVLGEYSLTAYVGTYPGEIIDSSNTTYTRTSLGKWATGNAIPQTIELYANYPNPFNPSTTIRYVLPEKAHVKIEVFNMLGQSVAVLVDGEQEAGYHSAVFEGAGLASGVYVYRLSANDPSTGSGQRFVQTKRFLLLR